MVGDIHEEKGVLYEDRIYFAGINQGGEFIFCPGRCSNMGSQASLFSQRLRYTQIHFMFFRWLNPSFV